MHRIHLFAIVVLLTATAVAGMLALSRTAAVNGSSSSATNGASISFQLKRLSRFEATLRRQLAQSTVASSSTGTGSSSGLITVYRRASSPSVSSIAFHGDDGHGDGGSHALGAGGRDD